MEHEQVKLLAYELWHSRGCPFGTPEVDWFHAEDQIRAQRDRVDPNTPIVTMAKTLGSVLGAVAELVSGVTGKPSR